MDILPFKRFYVHWREFITDYHDSLVSEAWRPIMRMRSNMIACIGTREYIRRMVPHADITPAAIVEFRDEAGRTITVNPDGCMLTDFVETHFDARTMPATIRLCDGKEFVL
jgi:hypothetical protein